ncbi:MAG TPA: cytochrome c peroxidase [Gemmatimonadales bacterium]|nr:cytochrome c peroxidase [Gemmatimonadales bacterium]
MLLARQASIKLIIVAGGIALLFACEERGGASRARSDTTATAFPVSAQPLGPIPPDDSLARPKSVQQVGVPIGLARAVMPRDNPQTPEKIALGERLFFDGRLSANGTVACASCHDPRLAFTDGRPVSVGIGNRLGQRNAPTVLNALYNKFQFWDGRTATLEAQAALPIINPVEMGQPTLDSAVARIAAVPDYRDAFRRAFGHQPNGVDLVRAIASYERSQLSFDAPFDHFMAGDSNAIDAAAKRGWVLFNTRGRCNKCHALTDTTSRPTTFTDDTFHNIGIGILRHRVVPLAHQAEQSIARGDTIAIDRAAILTPMSALGRYLITRKDADIASFKTPDLRNVLVTGPYFHDGSVTTLWDVVDHYNKGDGVQDPWLDEDIQPLALQENDIDDLVALMASLTSPSYRELAAKELTRQRQLSRTSRPQRDSARAFGRKPVQPKPPTP